MDITKEKLQLDSKWKELSGTQKFKQLSEMRKAYIKNLFDTAKNYNTVKPKLSFFNRLKEFEESYGISAEKFQDNDVKQMMKFFAHRNPSSLAVYFSLLKKYYKFISTTFNIGLNFDYTKINYKDYKDIVTTDTYLSKIITKEELENNIHKVSNHCDRLLLLLIFAGIKGDKNYELINLKKSDINWNEKYILVNGREVSFKNETIIRKELEETIKEDKYSVSNGSLGDNTTKLQMVSSAYVFRPFKEKRALKQDMQLYNQMTPQSIQRRVLELLQGASVPNGNGERIIIRKNLNKPNMTLQSLYLSGVLHRLIQYTNKVNNGVELTNKEVREWVDNNNISITKQELIVMYRDIRKAAANAVKQS